MLIVGGVPGRDFCIVQIPYPTTTKHPHTGRRGRAFSSTTPYSARTTEEPAEPGAWTEMHQEQPSPQDFGRTSRT